MRIELQYIGGRTNRGDEVLEMAGLCHTRPSRDLGTQTGSAVACQLFTRSQPSHAESATGDTALQHSVRRVRPAVHRRVEGNRCRKSLCVLSSDSRRFRRVTIALYASRPDDSEAC
jgi:hypothetical protein